MESTFEGKAIRSVVPFIFISLIIGLSGCSSYRAYRMTTACYYRCSNDSMHYFLSFKSNNKGELSTYKINNSTSYCDSFYWGAKSHHIAFAPMTGRIKFDNNVANYSNDYLYGRIDGVCMCFIRVPILYGFYQLDTYYENMESKNDSLIDCRCDNIDVSKAEQVKCPGKIKFLWLFRFGSNITDLLKDLTAPEYIKKNYPH